MSATCVIGLQWGDEAKGKVVDLLTEQHDIVVRYQGGTNAGHTVVGGGETYKLSLIPSGIFCPRVQCVVAGGVVLNPATILDEIDSLSARGVKVGENLMLSDRAHIIFPWHMEEDRLLNEQTGGEGKALVLGGSVGHQTGDARKNGVQETLEAAGMEVIGDWSDWDENKSAELTQNALTANPDINVVYTINEPAADGAHQALVAAGKKDVTIVTIDGSCNYVNGMLKDGTIAADSAQYPGKMAAMGIQTIADMARGGATPTLPDGKDFIDTGTMLITAEPIDGVESQTPDQAGQECWGS